MSLKIPRPLPLLASAGTIPTHQRGEEGREQNARARALQALTFIIIITLTPASKQINNTTTTATTTATGTRPVIASQFDDDSTRPRARVGYIQGR